MNLLDYNPLHNPRMILHALSRAAIIAVIAGAVIFLGAYRSLPASPSPVKPADRLKKTWPAPSEFAASDWNVFTGPETRTGTREHSLLKEYRLAGTFFYSIDDTERLRKAIVDRLSDNSQHIAGEGDSIGEVRVEKVYRDRVVLRKGSRELDLWLSFARSGGGRRGTDADTGAERAGGVSAGRFGVRRVSKNGRILSRESLLDYYTELRRNPERLVNVFKSLEPEYAEGGNITGYRLNIQGEKDFFDVTGLEEGDIVRKVNSWKMTNRRRAEHLIGEFVKNRVNVFYVDVERGDRNLKLRYYVR
ncbi:MAG: hypothetical protein R6V03_06245 [Kiritimatiellia bacterium]